MPAAIIGFLAAYLLGTIPSAYWIGRVYKGIDIRSVGSGNVGATNAARSLGKAAGLIVLLVDVAKGWLAVTVLSGWIISRSTFQPETVRALCGFAAVAGHIFNVFLGMRGGKGVATGWGVMMGVSASAGLIGAAVFGIVAKISGFVSVASICACVAIPLAMVLMGQPGAYIFLSAGLCVVIVMKHHANIQRLLCGTEHRIGGR